MPKAFKAGCKRPEAKSVVSKEINASENSTGLKEMKNMLKLGQKAPVFELAGYQNGEFLNFSLSEYLGKWVLLCFYPGDFTFV